jgi:hypothetical protein
MIQRNALQAARSQLTFSNIASTTLCIVAFYADAPPVAQRFDCHPWRLETTC